MDIINLFIRLLASKESSASKNTIKNYVADVRHFINWYEKSMKRNFEPNFVSADVLSLYEKSMGATLHEGAIDITAQLGVSSMKRHMSSLRKFFSVLSEQSVIEANPFTKVEPTANVQPTDYWHLRSFSDYLLMNRASKITVKNYISDIQSFAKWYEQAILPSLNNPLTSTGGFYLITQSILNDYKNRLLTIQNAAPRTINRKLSALRRYLDFASKKGFISASELILDPVKQAYEIIEDSNPKIKLVEIKEDLEPKKKTFSTFPPLRLLQRLIIFPYLALEEKSASIILSIITGKPVEGLQKLPKHLTKELTGKNDLRANNLTISNLIGVSGVNKAFYQPQKISLVGQPVYKKLIHHARFTRPDWYRKYHNYPFVHYAHFALLIIFASGVGIALYNNLVGQKQKEASAAPTAPPRVLSFQGRLTDNLDNPITTPTDIRFSIYNDPTASGGALLWQEVQYLIAPDQDGIFSVILGDITTIPSTVFSDNSSIYLGVTIRQTAELTPRQRVASVAYATNAEFLQGLPPTTQAGLTSFSNVVLALDSSGNLVLNDSSPTDHMFQVTNGQFSLSGETALLLTTNTGTDSNVVLSPDGLGKIDLQKGLINLTSMGNISSGAVEVNDKFAVLATESAVAAFMVNNNTTGGDIFTASSSGTTRFTIANDGQLTGSFYNTGGGIIYTTAAGIFSQTTAGAIGECLQSAGGLAPTWGTCAGEGYWNLVNGALTPIHDSVDLLIGGQSTASAKFRFINVLTGTPVASVSANSGDNAAFVSGNGTFGTTNRQSLTIGNSSIYNTTGNVLINPNGIGRIGVFTNNPLATFDLRGTSGTATAASISANTSFAALLVDNQGTGDFITASKGGQIYFRVNANSGNYLGQDYDGELVVGKSGNGKLTALVVDPIIVSNQKTSGVQSLTLHTAGASNADFIFQNQSTELGRLIQAGQFQLPITGSTGGLVLGGDTQLFRGSANRLDLASGDSFNIVNGSLLTGGVERIDPSGNGTFNSITVSSCTGCGPGGAASPFQQLLGAIVPVNSTLDLLVGSQSTDSAKFAVLGINDGTNPTASVSATTGENQGNGIVIAGDGSIQSLRRNTLALGGSTTGNISLSPLDGLGIVDVSGSLSTDRLITPYEQTVIVAKAGGDYTTIQAAIDSITDASASNRYTVLIYPGLYEEQVTMKSWVNLRGIGGKHSTRMTFTGNDNGTIILASNVQVEDILIEESDVASEWAIVGNNTSHVHIRNVDILGSGGNISQGIKISGNSWQTLFIEHSVINYLGSTGFGIYLTGNPAAPQNIDAHIVDTFVDSYFATTGGSIYIADTYAGRMRSSLVRTSSSGFDVSINDTSAGTTDFLIDSSTLEYGNTSLEVDTGATALLKESSVDTITENGRVLSWGSGISSPAGSFFVTGNIGIGTYDPLAGLHVNSSYGGNSALIANQLNLGDLFTASSAGATRFILANDGSMLLRGGQTSDIDTLTGTTLNIGATTATTISLGRSGQGITLPGFTAQNGILFGTNGSGALGQATTVTPGQCLLSGASNPSWGSCGAGGPNSPFQELNGAISPVNTDLDFLIGGQSTASAKFAVLNASGSGPATATVSGNLIVMPHNAMGGTVGIGTTNPLQELHVYQPIGNADVRIQGDSSSSYMDVFSGGVSQGLWGFGSLDMVFATNSTERLTIKNDGKVGIGNTNPSWKLDVAHTENPVNGTGITSAELSHLNASRIQLNSNTSSALEYASVEGFYGSLYFTANHSVTDSYLVGVHGDIQVNGSANIGPQMIAGLWGTALYNGTGTSIDTLMGVRGEITVDSGSGINTAALWAATPEYNGGSVANNYGVYIENQATSATNDWQLYSAGAADSYFAGNIGIKDSTPSHALQINDTNGIRIGNDSKYIDLFISGSESDINTNYDLNLNFAGTTSNDVIIGGGAGGARLGVGQVNPLAMLHIAGGTWGGNAAAIFDQVGASTNDIFSASSSGITRFTIGNSGQIGLGLSGGTPNFGISGQCLQSAGVGSGATWGSCGASGPNSPFQISTGAIIPVNTTLATLLGGTSSTSATLRVIGKGDPFAGTQVAASISANTSAPALLIDNSGTGDFLAASKGGQIYFRMNANSGNYLGQDYDGELVVGKSGNGKLTALVVDPIIVSNQKTSGIQSLTLHTAGASNADFIFQNVSTELSRLTQAGQFRLPITGATGGILLGGDTQIFRGNTNRIDIASGDSLNLVSGSLQIGGSTIIDNTGSATFNSITVNGTCTGCGAMGPNSPFQSLSGAIVPVNSTQDLLIGGQSTASANFAVLNVNGTGPATATVSGNFIVMPTNGAGGNVGIGTTNPTSRLAFASSTAASGGISFGSDANLYRSANNTLASTNNFFVGSTTNAITTTVTSAQNDILDDTSFFGVSSTRIGSDEYLRIAYVDESAETLIYTQCTNDDCSTNNKNVVEASAFVEQPWLTLGNDGFGRIIYEDSNLGTLEFKRCTNASCSTSTKTTINYSGTGLNVPFNIAADGFARIVLTDQITGDLHYIQCTNADCTASASATLDAGDYSSVDAPFELGADGFARIIYTDQGTGDLNFVQCTNASCSTRNTTAIISSDYSGASWLDIGGDGFARLIYTNDTSGDLVFAQCTNASCSTSNTTTLDAGDYSDFNTFTFGADGFARIIYQDYGSGDLVFVQCTNASCSTSNTSVIDSSNSSTGYYLGLDSNGNPNIVYQNGVTNTVYGITCTSVDCTNTSLKGRVGFVSEFGGYFNNFYEGNDGAFRFTYTDSSNAYLHVTALSNAEFTPDSNELYVAGDVGVNSNIFGDGNLFLAGEAQIGGDLALGGALDVDGASSFNNSLTVQGTSTFNGSVTINSSISSSSISTGSLFASNVSLSGNFTQTPGYTTYYSFDTTGNGFDVYASGKYIYVADDTSGLQILESSNLSSITLSGTLDTSGNAYGVFVNGTYAYVADGSSGLQIIDVSNPSSPLLVGTYNTSGTARKVYVSGKYAYVADEGSGLQIIDVSNPYSPLLVGTYNTSGTAYDVYVRGIYAYVADRTSGLAIVDISDPQNPILIGSYSTSIDATGIKVSGNYAYISDPTSGLRIINISNPSSLTLTGSYNPGINSFDVEVAGNYAYLIYNFYGAYAINIANPSSPFGSASLYAGGVQSNGIFISGKHLYLASSSNGIRVIDINGILTPAIYAGNVQTNNINVSENGAIANNLYVGGGLNLGSGGLLSLGALAVNSGNSGTNFIQGSPAGKALLTLNQMGNQDIFTASSSGTTRFSITNSGGLRLGSSEGISGQCIQSQGAGLAVTWGTCGGGGGVFESANGAIVAGNKTLDFIWGSNASTSARFQLWGDNRAGTNPGASISANTTAPGLLVVQNGPGDLFVASKSGATWLRLTGNSGNFGGTDYAGELEIGLNGTGKITAGVNDPPYTIDGIKFATYAPSTFGLVEEYTGKAVLSYDPTLKGYAYKLEFNNFQLHSDLWVFNRVIDPDVTDIKVFVTPNSNAKTWYKKDGENRTITLFADRPSEVSFRLTANRFNHADYPTLRTSGPIGFVPPPPTTDGSGDGNNNIDADPYFDTLTIYENEGWKLFDANNNEVSHVEAFSRAIIAHVEAGLIEAQKIVVGDFNAITAYISSLSGNTLNFAQGTFGSIQSAVSNLGSVTASSLSLTTNSVTIAGQSLTAYIESVVENMLSGQVISPTGEIDNLATNVISPLTDTSAPSIEFRDSKLEVRSSGETVSWFDNNGNASFSGTLTSNKIETNDASISGGLIASNIQTADASVSGTLRASNLIADNIQGLDDKIGTLAAVLNGSYQQSSGSGEFSNLFANLVNAGTITADFGIFEQGITSMGPITASDITAIDTLSVGSNFTIANNAINTLGAELAFQSLRQADITFQGGLIRMDTDGNMTVAGNLNLLGEIDAVFGIFSDSLTTPALATGLITPLPGGDLTIKLTHDSSSNSAKLKITNNNDHEVLSINERGDITSSGAATLSKLNFNLVGEAQASTLTEATATGSAGFATLRAYQPEITIKNPNITSKSLIYITPFGDTNNKVLYLLRQIPHTEDEEGSFTVGVSGPLPTQNIQFNWLIVN